jgi:hypothetical protein
MVGAASITTNARILLLCALAVLCGCQKDPDTTTTLTPQFKAKTTPAVKKGPTAAELTAGMVEAASQGKAQAAVDLKFELVQKPKVGQPLEINLALLPQVDAKSATIQIAAANGFTLADGAGQFETPVIAAGEVYRHTVNLLPTTDGVFLIGVTLLLKNDEGTDSRAFSIPVIVDR